MIGRTFRNLAIPALCLSIILPQYLQPLIQASGAATEFKGSANPGDWTTFNPHRFLYKERLVPSPALIDARAATYTTGTPSFPHDPSRLNIIYGRGPEALPTEIYAKAFDILSISNKYFQTPAAGESKQVLVNGQSITIYGTSPYTPLRDNTFVGNPVQISPFDPSRVFYKDKSMWPAVIYGVAGQEVSIAGQKVRIPSSGQSETIVFGSDGRLKTGGEIPGGNIVEGTSTGGSASPGSSGASSSSGPSTEKSGGATGSPSPDAGTGSSGGSEAAAKKAAEESAKKAAEEATKRAAEESAKKAAEESAKKAAEESAKRAAEESAKKAAEEAAKKAAEEAAKKAAEEAARKAAEEAAKRAAEEAAKRAALEEARKKEAEEEKKRQEEEEAEKLADEIFKILQDCILNDDWDLVNKGLSTSSRIHIAHNKGTLDATVIDQGTGYIPVGKPRFRGTYSTPIIPGGSCSGEAHRAYYGYKDPYWEPATIVVLDINNIRVEAPTGNLTVKRSVPIDFEKKKAEHLAEAKDKIKKEKEDDEKEREDKQKEMEKKYKEGPEWIQGEPHKKFDTRDEALKSWRDAVYETSVKSHREYAALLYQTEDGKWMYTPSERGRPAESYPDQVESRFLNENTQKELKIQEVIDLHTHDGHGVDGDSGYFQGRTFSGDDGDKGSAEKTGRTQIMLGSDGSLHEYIPSHLVEGPKSYIKVPYKETTQVLSKTDTFKGFAPTNPASYE